MSSKEAEEADETDAIKADIIREAYSLGDKSAADTLRRGRELVERDVAGEVSAEEAKRLAEQLTLKDVRAWIREHGRASGKEAKERIIEDVFGRYANIGSVEKTWREAREIDRRISRQDVKNWKERNHEKLTNLRGYNSYVAKKPREEYQLDLMFFENLKERDAGTRRKKPDLYNAALLMIDVFSRYVAVVPMFGKTETQVKAAIKKGIKEMGGKPKVVYHDAESAFITEAMQQYFVKNGIQSVTTLTHAPFAERAIRTVKGLLYPRVKHYGSKWWDEMPHVLEVYNKVDKNRTTGFTPEEARKPENQEEVWLNLEVNRVHDRNYPPLKIGDKVRVWKKKKVNEKENDPPWSKEVRTVTWVGATKKGRLQGFEHIQVDGPKLPAGKTYLLRHEVLKVPGLQSSSSFRSPTSCSSMYTCG